MAKKSNKIIISGNDTAQADIVVPTLAGNINGPIVSQSTKGRSYDLPEYDMLPGSGLVVAFKADFEEVPFEPGNPMFETSSVKEDAGGHVFRPIWKEWRVEKTDDIAQTAYKITQLRESILDQKLGGLYAYATYDGMSAPQILEMSVCGTMADDGLPLRLLHEVRSIKRPGEYSTRLMMCLVEQGCFMYGSQKESVHLGTFYSTMSPITVEQFGSFVADADYVTPPSGDNGATWADPKFDDGYKQGPDHPVVFVNYFDAEAFANWAAIRIPTEQEVEKSVRGNDGRTYPWGEEAPNEDLLQWSGPDGRTGKKIQKLGTSSVYAHPKGRSPHGILDAAGNVWVWTSSQ